MLMAQNSDATTYYVLGQDGHRYGPADVATLTQWAYDGRVLPTTLLEDAGSGARMPASAVAGITFGPQAMSPPPTPGPGQYGGGYSQPQAGNDGSGDVTAAWILGAIGFIACPLVLSSLGIYLASNARKKGHPSGQAAMIFCIASLVLGLVLNVVASTYLGTFDRLSR
jgi:hypothetical protein